MQPEGEYGQKMTDKYLSQIKDETLTIENDPDLTSLQFMRNLNPSQLKLIFCKNIIPTLTSSTIRELEIIYCNVQNLEHYHLENLEVLKLQCYKMDGVECAQILWNIVQFPKLQQLSLFGFVGVDVAPLSQIALSITKLSLNYCELKNVDHLKILINLKELNIAYNKYVDITALKDMSQLLALDLSFCSLEQIDTLRSLVNLRDLRIRCNQVDITPLQYLSELVRIDLNSCGLYNISTLQYLPNLEEVDITNNSIIYIQPLQELNSIVELDARFNKIVDFHTLQCHPNHNNYHLDFQEQPTNEEMYYIKSLQQEEIQYNKEMIIKYKQNVVKNKLLIQNDPYLTSLDFLQKLPISKLKLEYCENIIPKFTNNKIAELLIQTCNISNFKLIELNYLEILTLKSQNMKYAQQLIQFTKFRNLQELNVNGYHNIDFQTLVQMDQITRLSLSSCGLQDIENLRLLTYLKSLDISENYNIDFTCLQYFTQLSALNLRSCGLNTIDFLKNLTNLVELNIQNNQIMYIQIVEDLKKLSMLNAQNNRIIDEYKIMYHPHFKKFNFSDQEQPSEEMQREISRQRDSYVYKWEETNAKKYQRLIYKNESLTIQNDPELLCLHFMRNYNIRQLALNNCVNVTPILHNKNITQLEIKNCDIQSIQLLNLENLVILQHVSHKQLSESIQFYDLVKFKKLKQLYIQSSYNRELKLEGNIDITPLQNLTQLSVLYLDNCDILTIDAMNALVNLIELSLKSNKIVYIKPLLNLKKLLLLNVQYNQIVDIHTILNHPNYKKFSLDMQSRPQHDEMIQANKLRNINTPIHNLKKIQTQRYTQRYMCSSKKQNQQYD
ncbi:Conserved_hypothetical protein [Hexamita inflata]|uniref:Uncharacterized protein n=1 Tax=Hexamita inflata TaxID=28002 RepID=A0AA86P2K7_9EUKA|nr:Conserved hypothetical protein [Hexamita inflata]